MEQISFEARDNEYIDAKSGVSARLTITALENLLSSAERRVLINGGKKTTVRLSDFMGIIPSITGKVELVYEGEQEGSAIVAENLIGNAVRALLADYFPGLDNLKSSDKNNPYNELTDWFSQGESVDILNEFTDKEYQNTLDGIKPLQKLISKYQGKAGTQKYFFMEMILWALAEYSKLNKEKLVSGFNFSDLFSTYLRGGELGDLSS